MVSMSVEEIYTNTKNLLKKAGIDSYRKEAALLIERFFGMNTRQMAVYGVRPADMAMVPQLDRAIKRRLEGYPIQYILGEWEFYGIPLYVGEGVLIPRADTETLVDAALEIAGSLDNADGSLQICDLCSGSGCIPLALEQHLPEYAGIWGVEDSQDALSYFHRNLRRHRSGVHIIRGNVLEPVIAENFSSLDIITCNPPYLTGNDMKNLQTEVTFEPAFALDGGEDGLYFYRRITPLWKKKLKPGGTLLFEAGFGQTQEVVAILKENGFVNIRTWNDLSGILRVAAGQTPLESESS